MQVLLLTLGTRGDVQPFVALGQGLKRHGHHVAVVAPSNHERLVRSRGLAFRPLSVDQNTLLATPEGRALLLGGPVRNLSLSGTSVAMVQRLLDDAWEASRQTDLLIYHPKALGGPDIAEGRGIPAWIGATAPVVAPTVAFPAPVTLRGDLGAEFNRLTYRAVQAAAAPYHTVVNAWRANRLKLPARPLAGEPRRPNRRPLPALYAFSPQVVQPPEDWPRHHRAVGWWFLEPDLTWQPPADLATFVETGSPPICIGFGSMATEAPERVVRLALEALARVRRRGVLLTSWNGLSRGQIAAPLFVADAVPHDWLLPRCAAVVHHGGAGTVGAALRAGKPSVVCPFMADQGFWGQILYAAGCAPAPLLPRQLTAAGLAEALATALTDSSMITQAALMGEWVRGEDGVTTAIEALGVRSMLPA